MTSLLSVMATDPIAPIQDALDLVTACLCCLLTVAIFGLVFGVFGPMEVALPILSIVSFAQVFYAGWGLYQIHRRGLFRLS